MAEDFSNICQTYEGTLCLNVACQKFESEAIKFTTCATTFFALAKLPNQSVTHYR